MWGKEWGKGMEGGESVPLAQHWAEHSAILDVTGVLRQSLIPQFGTMRSMCDAPELGPLKKRILEVREPPILIT